MTTSFELSKITAGLMRLNQWNLSTDELTRFTDNCLSFGVDSFDLADIYGKYSCESLFGKVLKENNSLRQKIKIITKSGVKTLNTEKRPNQQIPYYDLSKDHLIESLNTSLRELNTDYVDLFLLHRPDFLMNPYEIADAFEEISKNGKALHFGVSNFSVSQFNMIASNTNFQLFCNQVEFSVFHHSPIYDGTLDQSLEYGIKPMFWSPLAGGRVFNPSNETEWRTIEEIKRISAELGEEDYSKILIKWIKMHPSDGVVVLGTGNINRIKSAVDSLKIEMNKEQWYRILKAHRGYNVP